MTFKGQLQHFSLAELFQALALNRHTGSLIVHRDREKKTIYFATGSIALLSEGKSVRIGEILLRQGKITPEILRAACEEQKDSGRLLGRILIDHGHITFDDVQNALRQKIEEELYDLFLWEGGTFEFLPDHCPSELLDPLQRHTQLKIDPTVIVMEALRQLDEIGVIRQQIPDTRAIIKKAASDETIEPQLSLEERIIWSLVGEFAPIDAVLENSPDTKIHTFKTIYQFMIAGWITTLSRHEYLELARGKRQSNHPEEAIPLYSYLAECVKEVQEDPEFLDEYGTFLIEQGERTRGSEFLSRALEIHRRNGDSQAAWETGMRLYQLGVTDLDLFRALWELRQYGEPKIVDRVRDTLLKELSRLEEHLEMDTIFRDLEGELGDQPSYWLERGEVQRLRNDKDQAAVCFERGLELLDPKRDLEEMIRIVRLLFDFDPSRGEIRERLQALLAQRERQEALKRRRFKIISVPSILLLALSAYPIYYEVKARELFQRARMLEVAYGQSRGYEAAIDAYRHVRDLYSCSTQASRAEAELLRLETQIADERRREEERRLEESRRKRESRQAERERARTLLQEANESEARGELETARQGYEELLESYAPLIDAEAIRFPLGIETDPPGATVSLDGRVLGATPLKIRYVPGAEFTVVLERVGCLRAEAHFRDEGQVILFVPLERTPIRVLPEQLPTLGDSVLVTADTLVTSCRNGYVYAFGSAVNDFRRARWGRKVGMIGHPAPNVSLLDDTLFIAASTGLVERVRLEDGQKLWFHQAHAPFSAPVAIHHEGAWIALGDESGQITLLDALSGEVRGRRKVSFPVTLLSFQKDGLAVVDRGRTYRRLDVPSLDVDFETILEHPGATILPGGGVLEVSGRVAVGDAAVTLPPPAGSVRILPDRVLYCSTDQQWVVIDGDRQHQGALPQPGASPPFIANGRVFVGGADGRLYCLGLDDEPGWSVPVDGKVFAIVPQTDGNLLVFLESGRMVIVEGS